MDISAGKGYSHRSMKEEEARNVIFEALAQQSWQNRKVLLILPDSTRTAPVGLVYKTIYEAIAHEAACVDAVIALGTHQPMSMKAIFKRVEISEQLFKERYSQKTRFFNHVWDDPNELVKIGTIPSGEIFQLSAGMMHEDVEVEINKCIFNYDCLMVVGPVFPHESVGYSGGNKYFFPGICGEEILHKFHWLGAMISNALINGTKETPVRKIIDRAASFINVPRLYFNLVVNRGTLHGLYVGDGENAWGQAADLSSKVNIIYTGRRYQKVLGIAPPKYDELWTAGKVAYKAETIVEDGGDMIIYAPHLTEFSFTHAKFIEKAGYHVRDYFLSRMELFSDIPTTILAHCVNVKGGGTYINGIERPRFNVILATGISKERCKELNLDYMNPDDIDLNKWQNNEHNGILCIPEAGEVLYKPE